MVLAAEKELKLIGEDLSFPDDLSQGLRLGLFKVDEVGEDFGVIISAEEDMQGQHDAVDV